MKNTKQNEINETNEEEIEIDEEETENKDEYDHLLKILLIGSSGVGKSSISNQFVNKNFNQKTLNTIGVDLKIKNIKYQNKIYRCQLWDTAGHERFKSITSSYYRGADCAIIVFDLTNKNSFQDLSFWFSEINNYTSSILFYLVGNKQDLTELRKNDNQSIEEFIIQQNIDNYIEVSAKKNVNIDQLFTNIVSKLHNKKFSKLQSYKEKEEAILPPSLINKNKLLRKQYNNLQNKCCIIL